MFSVINDTLLIPNVFVLETDPQELRIYEQCSQRLNFRMRAFDHSELFVAEALDKQPELMIYEVECSQAGLARQNELMQHGNYSAVVATARRISSALAVQVMEQGATTLLEKPIDLEKLEPAVTRGLSSAVNRREMQQKFERFSLMKKGLTARQRSVMQLIVAGCSTKAIAAQLDISTRLVELERAKILSSFGVETTPALALKCGEFLTLRKFGFSDGTPLLDDLRETAASSASGGADVN